MGQWYSICADIKPKLGDARKMVASYNAAVERMTNSGSAVFGEDPKREPVRSIIGLQKELFAAPQKEFRIERDGKCYSCFHGSYGWESVMCEIMDVIAPFLADESYLEMDMDEGSRTLVARGGKIAENNWETNEPDED